MNSPGPGGAGHETDAAGKPARVVRGVAAAIVGQPLDRFGELIDLPEAMFDTQHHEVADVLGADPGGRCDIAHGLADTAVEGEYDATFSPLSQAISGAALHASMAWHARAAPAFCSFLDLTAISLMAVFPNALFDLNAGADKRSADSVTADCEMIASRRGTRGFPRVTSTHSRTFSGA